MLAERLQEQFGIPVTAQRKRAVPRVLFSMKGGKGSRKKEFLALKICMIVNRVLPDHGQPRKYRRDLSQEQLAAGTGLKSRATFTRWMSLYSGQDLEAKRPAFVHRKRRFNEVNLYSSGMPEVQGTEWVVYRIATGKAVPKARYMSDTDAQTDCQQRNQAAGKIGYQVRGRVLDPTKFFYSPADVLEVMEAAEQDLNKPRFSRFFSADLAAELNLNGFFLCPEWVWHPNLGISYTARLVLSFYIGCGILQPGWVQVHQPKVGKALGMSIKTLYRAERELESIGLIRVVGQKRGRKPELKQWMDYPEDWRTINKILFLPIRKMTDAEIRAERRRMVAARRALHEARRVLRLRLRQRQLDAAKGAQLDQKRFTLALQACKTSRIARQVVKAHQGQTARMNEVWTKVQEECQKAGVERKLIAALIPNILAPPGVAIGPDSYQQAVGIKAIIERSLNKSAAGRS